jgi:hypothetical protein
VIKGPKGLKTAGPIEAMVDVESVDKSVTARRDAAVRPHIAEKKAAHEAAFC